MSGRDHIRPAFPFKGEGIALIFVACAATLLCSSCATAWVDEEGHCHILGLAHVVLIPPPSDIPIAGTTVRIDTLGVASLDVGEGRQWMVGYGRLAFA
ncbi:MAG: hypothetical protein D6740_01485, partial [Alphaproteobacteria bacterium]